MKGKLTGLVNRGINIFGIVMRCKLVNIIMLLFTGVLHIIDPRGGLRGTVGMLMIFIALYALLSIVFILTNKNKEIGEGVKFAGDMVKDTFNGNGNPITTINGVLSQNEQYKKEVAQAEVNSNWDKRIQTLTEKHTKTPKAGMIVMCTFYALILVAAVIMFFWADETILTVHIVLGALLVFDGVSNIWALISAKSNGIPIKGKLLSFFFNLLSVAVGVFFILLSGDSAEFTMVLCGVILVLKGLSDLFVMIRNRELITTVKITYNEIKHQDAAQIENAAEQNNTSDK